jgi:hypothetical protein
MSVLVLHHRGSLAGAPYDQWLADYDGDVLLLASAEHLRLVDEELPASGHGYRHLEAIEGYETSGRVEARALELAREHGVRYVIACQEQDLERAAQLREILGLPGQTYASVLPFRNKVLMKDALSAAGVPVADYAAVECAVDIVAFAERHGFPIVVKPRDAAGSIGVRIINTAAELDTYLAEEIDGQGSGQPNLMVESFVPGPMCFVDGLVIDGRIIYGWAARYLFAVAGYAADRGGRHSVTLDRDDPLAHRLVELVDKSLAALPGPRAFTFHAEVFEAPDGGVVLNEIACRTGGANIRGIVRTVAGIDPTECWVRAQVGLPLPEVVTGQRIWPQRMAGQIVFNKRPGTVLRVPGPPPFPWVRAANVFVRPGQVMGGSAFSSDFLAGFVVEGPDQRTCRERLTELESWFLDGLEIVEGAAGVERAAS